MLDEKSSNTTSVVVLCTAPDEATAQDLAAKVLAINLAFAVKLIFMPDALRQLHVGNFRVFRRNADLFTVEVVTVFDLPGQIKVMLVLLKIKSKGLIRGDKL